MNTTRFFNQGVGSLAAAAVLGILAVSGESAAQQDAFDLLAPYPEERLEHVPLRETIALERRFVAAEASELLGLRDPDTGAPLPRRQLRLRLFDDADVETTLLKLQPNERGFTWFGFIRGETIGDVILTVMDGVMMGTVHIGADAYHLRPVEPGVFELMQIDRAALPIDGIDDAPTGNYNDLRAALLSRRRGGRRHVLRGRRTFLREKNPYRIDQVGSGNYMITDSGGRIDLMVAYTEEALQASSTLEGSNGTFPTPNGILTVIQHAVDLSNATMQLSGIPTVLNLVHTFRVEDSEPPVDAETMLDLMEPQDGVFEELLTTGDQHHADITTLMVAGGENFDVCGRGYVLPELVEPSTQSYFLGRGKRSVNGKNVVKIWCSVFSLTLAHEIGHNAGLSHDLYAGEHPEPALTYGRGFVALGVQMRTVMSYDDLCLDVWNAPCNQVPRFSTPNLVVNGFPFGSVGASNWFQRIDAVSALTEALWTVANFRHSLYSP